MPKFKGTLEDLKDRLLVAGCDGEWVERGNGVHQLRGADGANLNWSSTKGTLWCDGDRATKGALEERVAKAIGESFESPQEGKPAPQPQNRKVFVVYGHDEVALKETEGMLLRWGLEPLILGQLPSGGKTIIEKLEHYREGVGFAVIITTPDDEGHAKEKPEEKLFRARQNVVLELGMMLAVLGRPKVAILMKSDVNMEKPSDIQGLIYIPWKEKVSDASVQLAKEMHSQGIKIDLAKL
ncbi:MAG: TIR domain-containing protein [Pseudomonadota bacterium]